MTPADLRHEPGEPAAAEGDLAPTPAERWPFYADDEIAAVEAVLRSGRVNQWTGDDVFQFERACAERFGGGQGIALANGSLALELALRAFGIGPGDEVIVTARSFVASASCVSLVGATPVFADVEPDSGNISAATVEPLIGPRTKAIIPVHLSGWPVDMGPIMDLAARNGLKVIEDCAQAPGATIAGRVVGTFGDAAAFSFCQDKIISTGGEGGFVSFRDPAALRWAWSFKDHGKNRDKMAEPQLQPGLFRYVHDSIGTNWRLTGPQAAIGLVQLGKLEDWLAARARNAAIWREALGSVPGLSVPQPPERMRHAYYKLYFTIDGDRAAAARAEILRRAWAEKLRLFSGSCPEIYREQAFADLGPVRCPVAATLGERSLMVEVHPTLDPQRLRRRAQRLAEIASQVLGEAGQ